jgi:iron(II)-dependent oxidoreductase
MVYVPAGDFPMGSTEADVAQALESYAGWAEDWFDGELPQHNVHLDAYWIDKYEVTNRQYAQFIEAGGYDQRDLWTQEGWNWKTRERRTQPRYWLSPPWNEPERPVVGVVWFEALAYCRWAGGRLPTDAEWERAAGWDAASGEKRIYPWGDDWDPGRANTKESARQQTTRVGEYCPEAESPVGACDMAGNVWEWCSSLHVPYPYDPSDGRENLESQGTRVLRSGSWLNAQVEARTTYRLPPFPGDFILFDPTNGFRCAMSDR